jgi:precorrin-6B methylase 2
MRTRTQATVAMNYAKRIKNLLVRDEVRLHKIRFGVCGGTYVPLNLRNKFRWPLGLYEHEISSWVRELVQPGATCYDIGAAEGYYSVCCAKLTAPSGMVISLEPEPRAFRLLQVTVEANSGLSPMRTVNAFVGRHADTGNRKTSIDRLVFEEGFPRPDFLKLDVEGAEYDVLCGAEQAILSSAPNMIIEVHSLELEQMCMDWLAQKRYRVVIVDQHRFLSENRPLPHNRWLCARRDHH